jgi:hypothetical protein
MNSVASIQKPLIGPTSPTVSEDFALWNGCTSILRECQEEKRFANHTFMLPLLIIPSLDVVHVRPKTKRSVCICLYGYTSRHKTQSVVVLKQDGVCEPIVGETDVLKMILSMVSIVNVSTYRGTEILIVVLNCLISDRKLDVEAPSTWFWDSRRYGREACFVPFKTSGQLDLDLPMLYVDPVYSHDAVKPWTLKSFTIAVWKVVKSYRR